MKEELRRCPVCDAYLRAKEGFFCPKCKRGPLCKNHRLPGERVCTSCTFDKKARELRDLKRQEQSLRSFLRLTQFIFLLFAVFFVSLKIGLLDTLEFLQETPVTHYVVYAMGAVSTVSFVLFYVVLSGQKGRVKEIESDLNNLKFRRLV